MIRDKIFYRLDWNNLRNKIFLKNKGLKAKNAYKIVFALPEEHKVSKNLIFIWIVNAVWIKGGNLEVDLNYSLRDFVSVEF